MRSFIILFGLCVAVSVQVCLAEDLEYDWHTYKMQHGKTYESKHIDALRMEIYHQNKQKIEKFNQEESYDAGFKLGLNNMSDWTVAEVEILNGFRAPGSVPANSPEAQQFLNNILGDNSIEVPDELDWRKTPGRVSEVKNQGDKCGSGWAFSATGALEGQEKVQNKSLENLIELSEQNLIDCVFDCFGCHKGSMNYAFDYVKKGIDSGSSYPYEAQFLYCRYKKRKAVFRDSGSAKLPVGDEETLKQTVAKFGPVSVAINVGEMFRSYSGGVLYDETCDAGKLNHAVLVVGYGTDRKLGDYWLAKNSWGSTWGEKGYIRMARNKKNNCGIASFAVVPVFSK